MRRLLLLSAALTALLVVAAPVCAAELTEKQALAKAVAILKGDPYGDTTAAVTAHITERKRGPRRETVCGGGASPAWAFHVVVTDAPNHDGGPIDGWLVVDAVSGRIVCANLPFLD
jgi:hypothetical protein